MTSNCKINAVIDKFDMSIQSRKTNIYSDTIPLKEIDYFAIINKHSRTGVTLSHPVQIKSCITIIHYLRK